MNDAGSAGESGEQAVRIASLHVYPVKSCGGITVDEALVIETGLEFDRTWMVVDANGLFVTQRELPRMALVQPRLKLSEMVLRAPGMLALHIALDRVETATRATVWNDEVAAYDMGELCAQWFSDFLGRPLRLVRFDPEHKRLSAKRWTGVIDAENAFADGFPILVTSVASIDELNRRLVAAGQAAVTSARFRPNLVLDGLDAHGEDALDEIAFATPDGPVRLKLVKPCARCPIPDVDPATAATGHAVRDALAGYRADARLDGAITFGMNAVIVDGVERALRVGLDGRATFAFD
ncbi:MAG TPA: MOSC N-terminal beta barrel domain-containing protein [Burkholderiaceae bacterium]|nr:MOSC N-terminal beta barrel domain-containing protein [Burkholderiaceae bacterium]